MIEFTIPGDPVPFARAGSSGKVRFTPKKQASFMNMVKIIAHQAMAGRAPLSGPVMLTVTTTYTYPQSWSQRKKDGTAWKVSRPDLSNLIKIIEDSMNGIVFDDDAQVVSLIARKSFGLVNETKVQVGEV